MNERTPLITTVDIRPVRRRYSHSTFRRFCTIALGSTLILTVFCFFFAAFFDPDFCYGPDHPWISTMRGNLTQEDLRKMVLSIPSSKMAAKWSEHYTSGPHLAGKNLTLASWTRDKWEEFGVQSEIVSYDVYLNYPVDHRLAMLEADNDDKDEPARWDIAFEASLTEDILEEDPTTGLDDRIPTFHGYSANGNVTAPFVYVNYGTYQDYQDLVDANVTLKGHIAIARYGGIFRGLKVKRAQDLGMVGVVLFTDPGDDGEITEENGYATYPAGPARNPSSVQRGSAQFLSIAPGDPTTPGYPSKPDAPRQSPDHAIAKIPSIPISYKDAIPILKALNGHGPQSSDFNKYWTANEGLRYKGVQYNIGPTPDNTVLNLYNKQDYVTTPLWNVIGIINGTITDEVIVLGNHRDAWIAGGAGDPNSGSSVMMEVVRTLGEAVKAGWKPLRTILFASWDGEEYALIGSTEWVEEYLPWLSASAVAYVNVDVGVMGPQFSTAAAPLLDNVLFEATSLVPSPDQTVAGQTVRDLWDGKIRTMGSGSDFTAFQDFAGIPSIDMGFRTGPEDAVYHYHSNYDSFHWMTTYGDPGFKYHRTMSQLLGTVATILADRPLVSFRAAAYAQALGGYLDKVEAKLDAVDDSRDDGHSPENNHAGDFITSSYASNYNDNIDPSIHIRASTTHPSNPPTGSSSSFRKSLHTLRRSLALFGQKAHELDVRADGLTRSLEKGIPWWKFWEWIRVIMQIRTTNSAYKVLERRFLYREGLDGRSWFKHVVFAPGLWTGYAGATYPGLVESIDDRDYENAVRWVGIIDECVGNATDSIS